MGQRRGAGGGAWHYVGEAGLAARHRAGNVLSPQARQAPLQARIGSAHALRAPVVARVRRVRDGEGRADLAGSRAIRPPRRSSSRICVHRDRGPRGRRSTAPHRIRHPGVTQTFWRVEKAKYAGVAKTGEGARLAGGRWTSPGQRTIYCAEHLSLAILEVLVHAPDPTQRAGRIRFHIRCDRRLVERLANSPLPPDFSPRTPYAVT